MEFVVAKKDIASALAKAASIPEQKNLSSVMANLLLESVGTDQVRLTAQSYEVTVETTFPAQVAIEGKMAISGRSLVDAVRMLPDAPVTVHLKENFWADLTAGRTDYKVPGILPDNMPTAQIPESSVRVNLSRDLLLEVAERVGFAMSMDEGRPNLNGIFLRIDPSDDGGILEAVATDGHRLSKLRRHVESVGEPQVVTALLHRRGVAELKRFLDDVEGDVGVEFSRHSALFRTQSGFLLIRQIELEYPDYRRVIPSEFSWNISMNRGELIDAVRRAGVVISSDKTPLVRFKFDDGRLQVMAQDPERGDAHSELDLEYDGEPLEIAYNNRYLLDALGAVPGKEVVLQVKDQGSASLLTSKDDDGVLLLIMPVRI